MIKGARSHRKPARDGSQLPFEEPADSGCLRASSHLTLWGRGAFYDRTSWRSFSVKVDHLRIVVRTDGADQGADLSPSNPVELALDPGTHTVEIEYLRQRTRRIYYFDNPEPDFEVNRKSVCRFILDAKPGWNYSCEAYVDEEERCRIRLVQAVQRPAWPGLDGGRAGARRS